MPQPSMRPALPPLHLAPACTLQCNGVEARAARSMHMHASREARYDGAPSHRLLPGAPLLHPHPSALSLTSPASSHTPLHEPPRQPSSNTVCTASLIPSPHPPPPPHPTPPITPAPTCSLPLWRPTHERRHVWCPGARALWRSSHAGAVWSSVNDWTKQAARQAKWPASVGGAAHTAGSGQQVVGCAREQRVL